MIFTRPGSISCQNYADYSETWPLLVDIIRIYSESSVFRENASVNWQVEAQDV